ncbi:unnamed protein product [Phytophthora lilii]|uniref:Unnamed protein product n=1 Tax=Phytophthora lilii TaxID=2077276 RepID=A0A9W6TCX8_9STRA|nr:unnamed protein product [Phytophthora lilii]
MGVVIASRDASKLEFSSEMMRRLCVEALPLREFRVVASANDPLELLAVSLRFISPKSVRHSNVKKKLSLSESVFHFELYASIRGILKANNSTKTVLAEASDSYDTGKRRLDIIDRNGEKYGYELKLIQLSKNEIIRAVQQADGYRRLLKFDAMFVINFVPQGHSIQQLVYNVQAYPRVKVIYVFFPDTCDEYTL